MNYNKVITKIPNNEFDYRWYINEIDYVDKKPQILVDRKGHRWFLGVDVSRMIGYTKFIDALNRVVDQKHIKRYSDLRRTTKPVKDKYIGDWYRFLSEEGVYQFILKSNKRRAKQLKDKYFEK